MLLELAVLSTFRCAQEIHKLTQAFPSPQVISAGEVAYAVSGEITAKPKLIVLNERTIAVFAWPGEKPAKKVRFTFQAPDPRHPYRNYFLNTGSGSLIGARQPQLHFGSPPEGSAPSDFAPLQYVPMPTKAALDLLAEALHSEIKVVQRRMKAGYMTREDLLKGNLTLCRLNPELKNAELIRSYVDELLWVSTPIQSQRLPAGF